MGESKGALAANISLVVVTSGRYARPRSRSVLEDVVVAGDAPFGARRRGLSRERTAKGDGPVVATRDLEPITESAGLNSSGATRRSRALGRH